MFSPSAEYPESRPFKIFISLLDKWEIGGALTEAMILDAFKALKSLIESDAASSEDVGVCCLLSLCFLSSTLQAVMTASTLYEAVEPHIVWKQLLSAILNELIGDGLRNEVRVAFVKRPLMLIFPLTQAIRLTHFILKTLNVRDEEIQVVHLPIVFSALCEALQVGKTFPSTGLDLTEVYVRFGSQVIQQPVPYQCCQTFCDFYMSLGPRYLCLRSFNYLWMVHD
jgi:hypothetical protein